MESICRFCGKLIDSEFDLNLMELPVLKSKVDKYLPHMDLKHKWLKTNICIGCKTKIDSWDFFYRKCGDTQKQLISQIHKQSLDAHSATNPIGESHSALRPKKMKNSYCCAKNCCNSIAHDKLFTLPKKLDRLKEWLELAGRVDLLSEFTLEELKRRQLKVCRQHFETKMFYTEAKNSLLPHAKPTLFQTNFIAEKRMSEEDFNICSDSKYRKISPRPNDSTVLLSKIASNTSQNSGSCSSASPNGSNFTAVYVNNIIEKNPVCMQPNDRSVPSQQDYAEKRSDYIVSPPQCPVISVNPPLLPLKPVDSNIQNSSLIESAKNIKQNISNALKTPTSAATCDVPLIFENADTFNVTRSIQVAKTREESQAVLITENCEIPHPIGELCNMGRNEEDMQSLDISEETVYEVSDYLNLPSPNLLPSSSLILTKECPLNCFNSDSEIILFDETIKSESDYYLLDQSMKHELSMPSSFSDVASSTCPSDMSNFNSLGVDYCDSNPLGPSSSYILLLDNFELHDL